MQALDTNVLLRYIVQDDLAQVRQVARIIERAQESQERLFISLIVLCETFWVLDYRYKQTREVIAHVIDEISKTTVFQLEEPAVVQTCLASYRAGRAGLADYLIGAVAEKSGCTSTITFDRDLKGAAGFQVL